MEEREIPLWGFNIKSINTSYFPDSDVILVSPVGEDGEEIEGMQIALDACTASYITEFVAAGIRSCLKDRRVFIKGEKIGIEAITNKMNDHYTVLELDRDLRDRQEKPPKVSIPCRFSHKYNLKHDRCRGKTLWGDCECKCHKTTK